MGFAWRHFLLLHTVSRVGGDILGSPGIRLFLIARQLVFPCVRVVGTQGEESVSSQPFTVQPLCPITL